MHNQLETELRKADTFACLRREIAQLERHYGESSSEGLKFRLPMDAAFEDGALPLGCVHEFKGALLRHIAYKRGDRPGQANVPVFPCR